VIEPPSKNYNNI